MGQAPPLRLSSSTEIIVVAFEPAFIAHAEAELEGKRNVPFLEKVSIEDPVLSTLVSLLMKESDSGAPQGTLYAESLAGAIASRFIYLAQGGVEGVAYAQPSSAQTISRVLDRMHADFTKDHSLRALAAQCGYSRRHFLRLFEEATGYTPHQYLLHLRLKHAKELLWKKSMPLVEVAAASGFSSQSHMSGVFRKLYGETPGQMRRMMGVAR